MNKIEIMNSIKEKKLKVAEILDTIASEKRELTNVEKITIESLNDEIKTLESNARNISDKPETKLIINSNGDSERFNLVRYLRNIKENNLSDFEKEINNEARKNSDIGVKGYVLPLNFERRTLAAGSTGYGKELISEEKFSLLAPLRESSIFDKLGATFLSGIKGNISIPVMGKNVASWKGENVSVSATDPGFTTVDFSPKRLTITLAVSNLLLYQDTTDAETIIKRDLVDAINAKLAQTAFSADSGNTNQPQGIFYNASLTVTGSTDWQKVVSLSTKTKIDNADVDTMYYVVRPEVLEKMKVTTKATNAGFIAEGDTIDGRKYIATNYLATSGSNYFTAYGNFKDLFVVFWNNLEIIEDKITGAAEGVTKYTISLYCDLGLVRQESVSKALLS